ncbi:DNA-binding protein [Limimaricola cinnabarinus]|uniref:DNA-binding protein n=1 Tax=Limimaricola cinnabarinus TaxID=1125964 RepID=A0A2G1MLH4_9RHOB|nr:DNA-binding protein [Limimaricola cinnabarinus]
MTRPVYYTANEVAEIFKRDPHTIRDWINHGCPTPDGPVKLQAMKLGKSWTIRDEWLAVFELRVRPSQGKPDLDLDTPSTTDKESS